MTARSKNLTPRSIPLTPDAAWPLLLYSVRYAVGRRSTAPSTTVDLVRRYWRLLLPEQVAQIVREIREEKYLGDSCDVATWTELCEWLERQTVPTRHQWRGAVRRRRCVVCGLQERYRTGPQGGEQAYWRLTDGTEVRTMPRCGR
jgi:hypothetical protein